MTVILRHRRCLDYEALYGYLRQQSRWIAVRATLGNASAFRLVAIWNHWERRQNESSALLLFRAVYEYRQAQRN